MSTKRSGPLLTRTEAAAYLRHKPQTLSNWYRRGKYRDELPVIRIGHRLMYRQSDLDRFLDHMANGSAAT